MPKVRKLKVNSEIVELPIFDSVELTKWIHDGVVVWEDGEEIPSDILMMLKIGNYNYLYYFDFAKKEFTRKTTGYYPDYLENYVKSTGYSIVSARSTSGRLFPIVNDINVNKYTTITYANTFFMFDKDYEYVVRVPSSSIGAYSRVSKETGVVEAEKRLTRQSIAAPFFNPTFPIGIYLNYIMTLDVENGILYETLYTHSIDMYPDMYGSDNLGYWYTENALIVINHLPITPEIGERINKYFIAQYNSDFNEMAMPIYKSFFSIPVSKGNARPVGFFYERDYEKKESSLFNNEQFYVLIRITNNTKGFAYYDMYEGRTSNPGFGTIQINRRLVVPYYDNDSKKWIDKTITIADEDGNYVDGDIRIGGSTSVSASTYSAGQGTHFTLDGNYIMPYFKGMSFILTQGDNRYFLFVDNYEFKKSKNNFLIDYIQPYN